MIKSGITLVLLILITSCSSSPTVDYPPPGQSYDIGTHKMHLYCVSEGSPTIILESGASIGITNWKEVQQSLSQNSRTCSYDRSGLVWSEKRKTKLSAETVATELNQLLTVSNENGPYVFVAASLGGIFARQYIENYPDQVSGLVLVDSSHPDQIEKMPPEFQSSVPGALRNSLLRNIASSILSTTGMAENMIRQSYITMPEEVTNLNIAYLDHSLPAIIEEIAEVPNLLAETSNDQFFGNIPVYIIAAGQTYKPEYGINSELPQDQLAQADKIHKELQEQLLSLSDNSLLIVAENSGHNINFEQPEIIIEAVEALIGDL